MKKNEVAGILIIVVMASTALVPPGLYYYEESKELSQVSPVDFSFTGKGKAFSADKEYVLNNLYANAFIHFTEGDKSYCSVVVHYSVAIDGQHHRIDFFYFSNKHTMLPANSTAIVSEAGKQYAYLDEDTGFEFKIVPARSGGLSHFDISGKTRIVDEGGEDRIVDIEASYVATPFNSILWSKRQFAHASPEFVETIWDGEWKAVVSFKPICVEVGRLNTPASVNDVEWYSVDIDTDFPGFPEFFKTFYVAMDSGTTCKIFYEKNTFSVIGENSVCDGYMKFILGKENILSVEGYVDTIEYDAKGFVSSNTFAQFRFGGIL